MKQKQSTFAYVGCGALREWLIAAWSALEAQEQK